MQTVPYKIRKAGFSDTNEIFNLIRAHPQELVPRSMNDIIQNTDRFLVAEVDGHVVGTVSWGILPEIGRAAHPTVEIKSLAVDASCRGAGIGRALVQAAIENIKVLQPEQIIVLTFAPEFFRKFGFQEIPKERIMHKLYTGCLNCTKYDNPLTCPEIAMALPMHAGS